jgi:uncharacterized protein YdiU (UPF0061 family)
MKYTLHDSLHSLRFDNRLVRDLPADSEMDNYRRQVTGAIYSRVNPTAVKKPELIAAAAEVAALLDLSASVSDQTEFAQVFGGNQLLAACSPMPVVTAAINLAIGPGSWAMDGRLI